MRLILEVWRYRVFSCFVWFLHRYLHVLGWRHICYIYTPDMYTVQAISWWRHDVTTIILDSPVSFILHSLWSGSVTVDSDEHIESFTSQSFVEYCHIGCHVFHLIIFQWCNLTRWSWQHNITQVYHRWKKTYKTLLISHLLNHFLHFEIYLRKLPAL